MPPWASRAKSFGPAKGAPLLSAGIVFCVSPSGVMRTSVFAS
jgi:hypothetical protein